MFCVCIISISSIHAQFRIKRIVLLPSGLYTGSDGIPICCDSDHDGLNEIIFSTAIPTRWEIWEHHPYIFNQYQLVYADTGAYPYPPGITTGNFRPFDVGDIDNDSLIDLLGPNYERANDTTFYIITTQESPKYHSYPENLSWWFRHSNNFIGEGGAGHYFPPDLDNDDRREILKGSSNPQYGLMIFENIANNNNQLVYTDNTRDGFNFAFGDFDLDGYYELVTATLGTLGIVDIRENIGDNQYQLIWTDTVRLPNGIDVFSGNDLDGDGKPEFFVAFYSGNTFYLYMWEATGNNRFERILIDQKTITVSYSTGRRSKCGDLDGDGIEELVWATPTRLFVYKATDNNQFQQVWQWSQDHGTNECLIVNIYDMNNNGYNEIVVGGSGKTSIFEVEAVRLLRPNGGEVFQDSTQELVQWQKFYPPRCDSISLFYSIDNGNNYTMITHGLSGNDTSYLWTVPNFNSDSCKVKIIAYGPGWQYDESDGVFRIAGTGIEEIGVADGNRAMTLRVFPNPIKSVFRVQYSIPSPSPQSSPINGKGFNKVTLQLFDTSGRLLKTLVDEYQNPGTYSLEIGNWKLKIPTGVYFLSLQTHEKRIIERLVIIK